MRQRTLHIVTITVVVLLLLVCSIMFNIPKHIQLSEWACDLSGNSVEMEIDIQIYRRLFRSPYAKGSVYVNGVEYLDEDTLYKTYLALRDKDRDSNEMCCHFPENMIFCKAPDTSVDRTAAFETITQNRISFIHLERDELFERFAFVFLDERLFSDDSANAVIFYGPAKTQTEAKKIADDFGREGEAE